MENISIENINLYEISIESNWITAYKNFILAYCGNRIKIFQFDEKMVFYLVKSYEMSFILFFSRYLSQDATKLVCRLLLNLISQGIKFKTAENILCNMMRRVKIECVKTVKISGDVIMLSYEDESIVYYDSNLGTVLQEYDIENNGIKRSLDELINIKRSKNIIEIVLDNQTLVKKQLGRIKQVDICNNIIFLRKSRKIIAVVFDINT